MVANAAAVAAMSILVNVSIVDLVDADNVAIAAQQCQQAKQGPWKQAPVDSMRVVNQGPGNQRAARQKAPQVRI